MVCRAGLIWEVPGGLGLIRIVIAVPMFLPTNLHQYSGFVLCLFVKTALISELPVMLKDDSATIKRQNK